MAAPSDTLSHEDALARRVGARIRALRKANKFSQSQLGEMIGVTFQQVQKYENGSNRISASRLWTTASCLGVPLSALLSDRDEETSLSDHRDEESRLLESWRAIDPSHRAAIMSLVEALAKGGKPSRRRSRGARPGVAANQD